MGNVRRIMRKYYLRQIVVCFLVYCLFFNPAIVLATPPPSNPVQVAGVTIDGYEGIGTDITKVKMGDSSRAVINWDSLDTLSDQELHFLKTTGNFAVLNRVIEGGATQFDGSLFGNQGDIFIVNTRGIVFGPESYIKARTFTASGIDISDRDFMNRDGQFQFEKNSSPYPYSYMIGDVTVEREDVPDVTEGEIHAKEIALIGRNVTNKGSIVASGRGNIVVMAAGDSVFLSRDGSDVVVDVDLNFSPFHVVDNGGSLGTGLGTISADGGKVILAAGDIYSTAISGVESLRAEATRNITLEGAVSANGDIALIADEDLQYGGDVTTNGTVTSEGGNVDIAGNLIKLNEDVSAEGGDLTITGRTSEGLAFVFDDFMGEGFYELERYWGYIDVAEETVLYASQNVKLIDAHGTDENPAPPGEMDLFGLGWLAIVAEGGSIQTQGPFGEGVKITVKDLSPAWLGMVQADPLNLADYSFGNQNSTDLYLQSFNGSITAVDSSQPLSGKNENAADQWLSIEAYAKTDITLQGHDASRDIKAGTLISYAVGFDTGNITVTSDNSKVLLTENVIANQGSVAVTAIDGGIVSSGHITASDGITLFGEVTADASVDQIFDAGQGTLWAKDTLSTITKGTGKLTLAADTLVNLDGVDGSSGDSVDVQAGALTIDGPVDAEGNLRATGVIQITGPAQLAGDVLSTGSGILFEDDVTADGVGSQLFDAGSGQLIAENGADIDKSTAGSLTLAGDTGIVLGGNVTGTGMESGDKLIFENNVTANGTGDAEDQRFDAGLGALDADGSIVKTTDGKLNLGGDEGIELGGNVETHDGDLTFEDAVTANGTGNQSLDAGTAWHSWGNDLVAADDIIKTTDGSLTLDGGRGDTDSEIYLAGNVETHDGDLIFEDKVVANGTGDQSLDAGTTWHSWGNDLVAEQDIIKTTDGSLTLDGGRGDTDSEIYLAGNVETTDGDLTFEDKVIANGSGNQRFDAIGGKLWAQESITKTTAGNLDMFGGYNGPLYPGMDYSVHTQDVTVDDGELSIAGNATVRLDGSIYSKGKMTLASNANGIASTPSKATPTSPPYSYDQLIHNSGTIQSLNGDVDLSAQNSSIFLNGGSNPTDAYVSAGGDILIRNYTWVQNSRKLDAGDDIVLAEGKRLQGNGSLSLAAGDDIIIGSTDVDNHWLAPEDDTGIPSEVKANGDLILNAVDDVYVHGELITLDGSGGDIEITASDDTIHLYGNVTADQTDGGDIILHANTEVVDGVTLDAGDDVEALGTVTGEGDLTINAGTIESGSASDYANIRLHQTVTVEGSLVMTAGDDIEAADTLMATGTNGAGNMILNAGDDIDLDGTAVSAQSAGLMELIADLDPSNGTGNVDVDGSLEGNMKLSGTNVYVDGTVTSHGTLDVDADDDIELRANVSSVGEMTMDAGSDIKLNRSSGNTSSESTITLNAGDDVTIGRVFSGEGNVTANGKMDIFAGSDSDDSVKVFGKLTTTNGGNIHVTAGDDIKLYGTFNGPDFESAQADGDLTLDAEDDVDVLGDLISNNGSIDIYSSDDTTYLGGDVTAAVDVTLHNNTILDGGDNQTLEAGHGEGYGTLTAEGFVWKTTPGNLYLYGDNPGTDAISLNYAGCLPAASTSLGNLEISAETGDIQISGDLTTFGMSEDPDICNWYDRPTGGVSIIAEKGKIYTEGAGEEGEYMLNIGVVGNSDHYQCLGVDLPWGEEGKAAIVVLSRDDLIFGPDTMLIARGNYYDAGGKSIWDFIDFTDVDSYDDYFDIFDNLFDEQLGGCIAGQGAFCSAVYDFLADLDEGGFDFGDPDAFKDLFTDFVDEYFEDLLIVDDRAAINFLDTPDTIIGGVTRDQGDAIDVAVYLASTEGDVHLDGRAIDVAEAGTMVVDAYDTVTFGDFETFNLEDFDSCKDLGCFLIKLAIRFHEDIDFADLCQAFDDYKAQYDWTDKTVKDLLEDFLNFYFDEGFFFNIDRLEVASRISEWLFEAVGRLPFANDPAGIAALKAFIGGDYILRGAGLGNPSITDGKAWVLEDPLSPAPLYREAGEASEDQEFGEGGCPPLMNWLAIEIGIPTEDIQVFVADALALNTDIQPCDMCARLLDASKTMEDVEGTQIAAMARVVNEFVTTPAPPSPEQMILIAAALAEHVGDGTYYASAEKWIDALVAYVGIMNTEMGYSASDSAAFAEKYLTPVTETGNVSLIAYVKARLAALGG